MFRDDLKLGLHRTLADSLHLPVEHVAQRRRGARVSLVVVRNNDEVSDPAIGMVG